MSGKNKQDIENTTEDLNCLTQWLIDNKLSLHLGKTESILFGSPQKIKCCLEINPVITWLLSKCDIQAVVLVMFVLQGKVG